MSGWGINRVAGGWRLQGEIELRAGESLALAITSSKGGKAELEPAGDGSNPLTQSAVCDWLIAAWMWLCKEGADAPLEGQARNELPGLILRVTDGLPPGLMQERIKAALIRNWKMADGAPPPTPDAGPKVLFPAVVRAAGELCGRRLLMLEAGGDPAHAPIWTPNRRRLAGLDAAGLLDALSCNVAAGFRPHVVRLPAIQASAKSLIAWDQIESGVAAGLPGADGDFWSFVQHQPFCWLAQPDHWVPDSAVLHDVTELTPESGVILQNGDVERLPKPGLLRYVASPMVLGAFPLKVCSGAWHAFEVEGASHSPLRGVLVLEPIRCAAWVCRLGDERRLAINVLDPGVLRRIVAWRRSGRPDALLAYVGDHCIRISSAALTHPP